MSHRSIGSDHAYILANQIVGTCDAMQVHMDDFGTDFDTLEAATEEYGVIRCMNCGWWFHVSDLDEDCKCSECQ